MLLRCLVVIACMLYPLITYAQINVENVLDMGRRAIGIDDYLTSIQHFNKVAEARPNDYRAYYYRAYAKFSLEDYQGAADDCTQALTCNPYITEVYQLRGLCRIHLSDFQGAIEDYDYVTHHLPDEQGAYYNRALCKLELKQFESADSDMDIILNKWRNFHRAYLIKAQIKFEEKDTVGGMVWIDSLLKIDPLEQQAWAIKGKHALSQNDYSTADTCLTHAIQINPKDHTNYIARAQARHGLNMFGYALQDYDKTIELVPEHFVAHYNRGLLRALMGDDNRAIEDFDFVIAIEPDNVLAIYNRALLREQTGDYPGAIEDYTALLKFYPNFLDGHIARGRCRRKVGDIKGAIADETAAARTRLDLTFKPGKRKPVKKVRKTSDHHLEQYQQLVEEEADTTQRYVRQLFGKIQHKHVACEPLPSFEFRIATEPHHQQPTHKPFLPELEQINATKQHPHTISLEASPQNIRTQAYTDDLSTANNNRTATEKDSAEQHFLESIIDYQNKKYDDALEKINQAIATQTKNYLFLLHRANVYHRLACSDTTKHSTMNVPNSKTQNSQRALADIDSAIRQTNNHAILLYNRGCMLYDTNELDKAIDAFTQAIETDNKVAQAYYNRAITYMKQGKPQQALSDFSKAGELGLSQAYNLIRQAAKEIQKQQSEKK